jgi:hypothetical protein
MLRNYEHDFDFFVQCAEAFEEMYSHQNSSTEESRLIDVDEITCMPFVYVYRQVRFVYVCTCACTEIDLVCLHSCMHNLVHISAR